jgi:ADP-ribosylglycohydrolase
MKRLFYHEPYKYDDDTLKQVHRGILGAIIGDIVGSRLEFKRNKEYNFELFTDANDFTDDTVMTIAVADWLTLSETRPVSNDVLPDIMRSWGRKHLLRGYGRMFHRWLMSDYEADQRPYNSFGNGAGMRVSACGYFATTLDEALHLAKLSAEVSHNHPEGIKGAQSIASAIFLARQHQPKESIREYIARQFGYDMDRSCDSIRPGYNFDETCQGSSLRLLSPSWIVPTLRMPFAWQYRWVAMPIPSVQ